MSRPKLTDGTLYMVSRSMRPIRPKFAKRTTWRSMVNKAHHSMFLGVSMCEWQPLHVIWYLSAEMTINPLFFAISRSKRTCSDQTYLTNYEIYSFTNFSQNPKGPCLEQSPIPDFCGIFNILSRFPAFISYFYNIINYLTQNLLTASNGSFSYLMCSIDSYLRQISTSINVFPARPSHP